MGKMSDMLINGATDEEMSSMIDNARNQHNEGYIQFLEEQLEKAETLIRRIKDMADEVKDMADDKVSIQESMASSYIDSYYNDKK